MLEFIALGLFLAGVSGVSYLFVRKGYLLEGLEEVRPTEFVIIKRYVGRSWDKIIARLVKSFEGFSWDLMIQTTLSRIRILILKVDNAVASYLSQVRERSKKQKEREEYWKRISRLVRKDEDREPKASV